MNGESATVFVVDDDPSVRRGLERLLRAAGYGGDVARMLPAIRITIAVHAFVGIVLIFAVLLG